VKTRCVAGSKIIWLGRLPVAFQRATCFSVSSAKTVNRVVVAVGGEAAVERGRECDAAHARAVGHIADDLERVHVHDDDVSFVRE